MNGLISIATLCACLLYFGGPSSALYQDQTGTYDWIKDYIGKVEDTVFENSISMSKHLYVSTEKNIIACISTRTGQLVWRKLYGDKDGKVSHMTHVKDGLLTVTCRGMARLWDSATGVLKLEVDLAMAGEKGDDFKIYDVATMERSYTEGNLLVVLSSTGLHAVSLLTARKPATQTVVFEQRLTSGLKDQIYVDSSSGRILHIQLLSGARLSVHVYGAKELNSMSQITIDTSWLDSLDMTAVLEDNLLLYISVDSGTIHLVDLVEGSTKSTTSLSSLGVSNPMSLVTNKDKDVSRHGSDVILVHGEGKVSQLRNDENTNNVVVMWTKVQSGLLDVEIKQQGSEVYAYFSSTDKSDLTVTAMNVKTGVTDESLTITYKLPDRTTGINKVYINMYLKRNTPIGFRVLVDFADESILLVAHPNRAAWQRHEALASVVHATMLDLPLSDVDAGIEAEFEESGKTRIADMFVKRVTAQISQFVSWVKQMQKEIEEDTFFKHKTRDPLIQVEGPTRDPFSLHKMIVLVTKSGTLFGIDSLTAEIVWRYYSGSLHGRKLQFFVQRTTAHFPNPPQAVLLALDPTHEQPTTVLLINPITGAASDLSSDFSSKEHPFLQATLSPMPNTHHLRPLILLDAELKVHLVPDTPDVRGSMEDLNLFMYDINRSDGLIRGFSVRNTDSAQHIWSVHIPKSHSIVGFAGKFPFEKVDSMGRPLADRSVIYKYLNPNLVAVLSESTDNNVDRASLLLHMIDAVTGQIIHSSIHKKASGPVHIVHSENWLIYSYWNTKARRTEISSIELYDGKKRFNDTIFSSFHSRPSPPLVMQQAYVFPAGISSMGVSRTEKGITSRQILFGLKRGSLFGMPRRFFDPRRPLDMSESHREEGLIQYMPEIPIPPELFLSYNLTVEKIDAIYSATAALESTSLILATGLDIFFTRTQPSKMFDVLKEDFDHLFIASVLSVMLVAALATRRMAQVKQLKKAWR